MRSVFVGTPMLATRGKVGAATPFCRSSNGARTGDSRRKSAAFPPPRRPRFLGEPLWLSPPSRLAFCRYAASRRELEETQQALDAVLSEVEALLSHHTEVSDTVQRDLRKQLTRCLSDLRSKLQESRGLLQRPSNERTEAKLSTLDADLNSIREKVASLRQDFVDLSAARGRLTKELCLAELEGASLGDLEGFDQDEREVLQGLLDVFKDVTRKGKDGALELKNLILAVQAAKECRPQNAQAAIETVEKVELTRIFDLYANLFPIETGAPEASEAEIEAQSAQNDVTDKGEEKEKTLDAVEPVKEVPLPKTEQPDVEQEAVEAKTEAAQPTETRVEQELAEPVVSETTEPPPTPRVAAPATPLEKTPVPTPSGERAPAVDDVPRQKEAPGETVKPMPAGDNSAAATVPSAFKTPVSERPVIVRPPRSTASKVLPERETFVGNGNGRGGQSGGGGNGGGDSDSYDSGGEYSAEGGVQGLWVVLGFLVAAVAFVMFLPEDKADLREQLRWERIQSWFQKVTGSPPSPPVTEKDAGRKNRRR